MNNSACLTKNVVIVINGKPRSGKDTAVEMMQQMLYDISVPNRACSSIDPVKYMLLSAGVYVTNKTEEDRKLLSVVGDALEEHSEFRTRYVKQTADSFIARYAGQRVAFFFHMREPHLIDKVRASCEAQGMHFISIYLESNRGENITSNASDAGVANGTYDVTIENNGTIANLTAECGKFLRKLGFEVRH